MINFLTNMWKISASVFATLFFLFMSLLLVDAIVYTFEVWNRPV